MFGGDANLTSAYAGFLGPLADQALGRLPVLLGCLLIFAIGSVITAAMQGSRVLLVEVQALTASRARGRRSRDLRMGRTSCLAA